MRFLCLKAGSRPAPSLSLALRAVVLKTDQPRVCSSSWWGQFGPAAVLAVRAPRPKGGRLTPSLMHAFTSVLVEGVRSSRQAPQLRGLSLMPPSHTALGVGEGVVFIRASPASTDPWPRWVCFSLGFLSANGDILHLGLGNQMGRFRGEDIGCPRNLALNISPMLNLMFCPRIEVSWALDQMWGKLVYCFPVALVFLVRTSDNKQLSDMLSLLASSPFHPP